HRNTYTHHLHLPCSLFLFPHPSPPSTYTLSLHDALPISGALHDTRGERCADAQAVQFVGHFQADLGDVRGHAQTDVAGDADDGADRKSTRLNSSHLGISYAVFCLKKKKI